MIQRLFYVPLVYHVLRAIYRGKLEGSYNSIIGLLSLALLKSLTNSIERGDALGVRDLDSKALLEALETALDAPGPKTACQLIRAALDYTEGYR